MNHMMRSMDAAAAAAAAPGGGHFTAPGAGAPLPAGATFVSHAATYSSDGRRSETTTRAAGGVRETQRFVDDGRGRQRCTVERGLGERVRRHCCTSKRRLYTALSS